MFRFPERAKGIEDLKVVRRDFYLEEPDKAEKGIIHGRVASSEEEYRVAKALWKMNKEFIYQYSLFGGRHRRGGYEIDFYVEAHPVWIPLEVVGLHWHTGKHGADDRFRYARIEKQLGHPVVFVYEDQLTTDDDAYRAVRDVIGPN